MKRRTEGGFLAVLISLLCAGLHPQTPSVNPVPLQPSLEILQERSVKLIEALVVLDRLIGEAEPKGLKRADQREYGKHTVWLKSIRFRFSRYQKMLDGFIRKNKTKPSPTGAGDQTRQPPDSQALQFKMKRLNNEFSRLTAQILIESRTFARVSNFLKARHDCAMATIRNTK